MSIIRGIGQNINEASNWPERAFFGTQSTQNRFAICFSEATMKLSGLWPPDIKHRWERHDHMANNSNNAAKYKEFCPEYSVFAHLQLNEHSVNRT